MPPQENNYDSKQLNEPFYIFKPKKLKCFLSISRILSFKKLININYFFSLYKSISQMIKVKSKAFRTLFQNLEVLLNSHLN